MNRRQRRHNKKILNKEYDKLSIKKEKLSKKLSKNLELMGIKNGFETVKDYKSFWFGSRLIKGPKMAPTTTWRIRGLMIRYNIENLYIGLFGWVLKIRNWTIRSKIKPKGSFFKWSISFYKRRR